jgi:hypothetical protein
MRPVLPLLFSALALVPLSCTKTPKAGGTRESGQSNLMSQSFAGQNACNPDNHLRPFIIEWDATDMSSFESHAANDIVVVRYEGCNLVVLDECRNESIRGEQGSYRPPEWTSGSLETLDISNEGELYAKLPLGQATLGGRVNGGEKFHMEYFVAGTRMATRDSVYTKDIASNPGCEGATHFVHAYNLGAFALGSAQHLDTSVGGSIYGFGAGGSTSHKKNAEKKGGDLGVCRGESATEVAGCKAPIRLSLRPIRDGENPDAVAMKAPDTMESLNAAGQINMKIEMSDEARGRLESAMAKANARDGKGCLKELDAHAKLDPKHDSQDPKSGFSFVRGQCLMLAGKCDAGKQLMRKTFQNGPTAQYGDEFIDKSVEGMTQMYCQGKMNDRDTLLQAWQELTMAASTTKKTVKFCDEKAATLLKVGKKVEPKDGEDYNVVSAKDPKQVRLYQQMCYARAGDCDKAYKGYKADMIAKVEPKTIEYYEENGGIDKLVRPSFDSMFKKCTGKGK